MASSVPMTANEFIEQQLNERITALEKCFDADALCIVSPIVDPVANLIRAMVEDLRQGNRHPSRLAVMLTTNGGYIETAERIATTLRHHYNHIVFIVPDYAFSAGTVLVMAGDEIYMDYYSRLGPIDPQVRNAKGQFVPALGYLVQWERLIKKATKGKLTTEEAALMAEFDLAELYQYEQARELSIALLEQWLAEYKFKNWIKTETRRITVTSAMRKRRARAIAQELNNTNRWHSHGYGISMEVLQKDLDLKIDDLDSDPNICMCVKQYDGLLMDYMHKRGDIGTLHSVHKYLPIT